jgi:hypothetical protein
MNLFTGVKGFEELEQMARKVKHKRVHYKTTTYTKVYKNDVIDGKIQHNDIFLWGRMRELHKRLANFFPIFFSNIDPSIIEEDFKVYDFGVVRVWDNVYLPETYTHKGAIYKGQEFRVIEAEIAGSEDLNIQERIYLHETLLELLEEGYNINQLNWYIESLVNLFKQGWTANLLVLAMLGMEDTQSPPNLDGKEDIMT